MKLLIAVAAVFLCSFTTPPIHWESNFNEARQIAAAQHKHILLNFSGSDWCGPCIKMHQEIFNTESFSTFAGKNLILVNADFPRKKKNQLPLTQQTQNDELAERYNGKGAFPFTVLLNEDGKVLKTWDGLPKITTDEFITEINRVINAPDR